MKNSSKLKALSLVFILITGMKAFSGTRYWRGNGSNLNWSSTGNWSATPGGATGASVPGSNDSAYFGSYGTGQCSLNMAVNVKRLEMTSGYTDTLKQNSYIVGVGTTGIVLSGGTFSGGSSNIFNNGIFTLSGANFISTSASLVIEKDYTFTSGTFAHNNGTVKLSGNFSMSGSTTFYNLILGSNSTIALDTLSTFIVENTTSEEGTAPVKLNGGKLHVRGDFNETNVNTAGGGTGTFVIDGTGDQMLNGSAVIAQGKLCNVTIDKPSGTLYLKDYIAVGDWQRLNGTIDADTYNSTLVFYASASRIISTTEPLHNVSFYANSNCTNTIPSGDTLTVNGTLTFESTGIITINTGTVNAKGDITVTNTNSSNVGNGGTGWINICGTGNQTLTGSGTADHGRLCNIKVNKPSGTLYLASIFTLGAATGTVNWEYVQGTVDPGTSEIVFFGNGNVNCVNGAASMDFYNFFNQSGTRSFTSDVNVKNSFIISLARTVDAGIYKLTVGGNWDNSGTFTAGTGKVVFNGSADQYFLNPATQTFYNAEINKPSGKLYLNSRIMTVSDSLVLKKGIIASTASKPVSLTNGAVCTGGSDSSYVSGVFKKTGNQAFVFPLGDTLAGTTGAYHPLSITAPASSTNAYTARYLSHNVTADHTGYTALQTDSLTSVSSCEYWQLDRASGTPSSVPSLGWTAGSCNAFCSKLRVAYYNTSAAQWTSMGYDGITTSGSTGTVKAHSNSGGQDTLRLVIAHPLSPNLNPVITVSAGDTICAGDTTALSVSGAATYAWSPAGSISDSTSASVNAFPAATTTYTVIGTSASGCRDTATVTVQVNPSPVITAPDITLCPGITSGVLTASGAVAYTWSPATGLSDTTGAMVTASPSVTTTYVVTGTDAAGCTGQESVTVTIDYANDISTEMLPASCKDTCDGAARVSAVADATYDWLPGTPAGDGTRTVTGLCAGTYTCVITTKAGCKDSIPVTVTYSRECIYPGCCASFAIQTTDTAVCLGHALVVRMNHSGCSDSLYADYGDGHDTLLTLAGRYALSHTYAAAGVYKFRILISGNGNCRPVGDSITVHVRDCGAPQCFDCVNSFSPVPGKKYMVSGWVKEDSAALSKTSYTYPGITIGCPSVSYTSALFTPSGAIIDGWQRIEGEFTIPAAATDINITLSCSSGSCLFDDIRVFPFDGSMKSYVYDPVNMRLVAELDERNYATLYEYDEEGKLVRVKKETEKGIMTIKENRNNTKK